MSEQVWYHARWNRIAIGGVVPEGSVMAGKYLIIWYASSPRREILEILNPDYMIEFGWQKVCDL